MFVAIILAAATATAAPALPPATQSLDTPLRVVSYKVSVTLQTNQMSETFGGYAPSGTTGVPDTIGLAPSSTGSRGGSGTVTVAVMAAGPDGSLAIRVTEKWDGVAQPLTFDGVVEPDGTVDFAASTITDASRELLSYFGTRFAPQSGLTPTTHWNTVQKYADAEVDSDYTITAVDHGVATVQKKQTVKPVSVSIQGTVQYDATNLAPISGRITQIINSESYQAQTQMGYGGGQSDQERKLLIQFTRLSDSRTVSQSQP